jgi:hypothetical protein
MVEVRCAERYKGKPCGRPILDVFRCGTEEADRVPGTLEAIYDVAVGPTRDNWVEVGSGWETGAHREERLDHPDEWYKVVGDKLYVKQVVEKVSFEGRWWGSDGSGCPIWIPGAGAPDYAPTDLPAWCDRHATIAVPVRDLLAAAERASTEKRKVRITARRARAL